MTGADDFPRMLFRSGTALRDWHGHDLDWQIVDDEAEQAAALKAGWRISPDPLDHDADGRPGGSIKGKPKTRKTLSVKDGE